MEPAKRMKLGEILIQQNVLTPLLVQRVLQISNETHRRFGQTLEDMGLLTGEELAQALAFQFGFKIVTGINRLHISPETLGLITAEESFDNRVFPLQVKDGKLALAVADPTNSDIVDGLSERLDLKVVPFIATTREIMKAIAKNYLGIMLKEEKNQILVVDPDSAERGRLVSTLARGQYHVLEALDAEDGFQQALMQVPSLVITARDMPFSDGFAFFTNLQSVADTRRIPVILLSPRGSEEEEATAFKRGFFDYIPLPVRDITLLARVERALGAGGTCRLHRQEAVPLDID
jgi:CheY-like chemotaxis protein